jgi:hypothetical protein
MCFVVTSTWKDRTWPSPPQICIFYDVLHLYVHLGTFLSVTLCTYCYIRVLFIVHLSITTQSVRQKKSSRGIQGKSQHHAQQRNESKQRTTILLVPPSPPPPHHPTAVVSIFIFIQVCFPAGTPPPPPPFRPCCASLCRWTALLGGGAVWGHGRARCWLDRGTSRGYIPICFLH